LASPQRQTAQMPARTNWHADGPNTLATVAAKQLKGRAEAAQEKADFPYPKEPKEAKAQLIKGLGRSV